MISVFTSDDGSFPHIDFTRPVTDKGVGEGVNIDVNYPLPRGIKDSDYRTALLKPIEDIRATLIAQFISLGVDTVADNLSYILLLLYCLRQTWEN